MPGAGKDLQLVSRDSGNRIGGGCRRKAFTEGTDRNLGFHSSYREFDVLNQGLARRQGDHGAFGRTEFRRTDRDLVASGLKCRYRIGSRVAGLNLGFCSGGLIDHPYQCPGDDSVMRIGHSASDLRLLRKSTNCEK
jgi:hypothetical protein